MSVRLSLVAPPVSLIRMTGITGKQEQLYLQVSGKLESQADVGKRGRIPRSFHNRSSLSNTHWGDSAPLCFSRFCSIISLLSCVFSLPHGSDFLKAVYQ